jgi:Alanine racemase, C-terminal domain
MTWSAVIVYAGEHCPIVGRISMDAITVRLPCRPDDRELFTIMTADFDPVTSVTGIADTVGTIQNEVLIRISTRLPRVYRLNTGHVASVNDALDLVRNENDQLMKLRPGFGPSYRSMSSPRTDMAWSPC